MLTWFQIMRRFKCVFLMLLLCASTDAAQVDYYSPENVLQFADFLFQEGDYLRAAGEYQRYLYYARLKSASELSRATSTHLTDDSVGIHYKIALCYRFGGKPMQALDAFEKLLETHPQSAFKSRAYYQIGVSYFLMERFADSAQFLRERLPDITDARQYAESEQLIGLAYLMQKQWHEAGEVFKALQTSEVAAVREKAAAYHNDAVQGAKLPTRNPFVAGFLSAILPGAGRFYTGRTGDAITSLMVVGLTGWQAYDGFSRDGITSVKGWTFGTISGAFYLGNIYGSVISARVYNHTVENEFLTTLSIELPF